VKVAPSIARKKAWRKNVGKIKSESMELSDLNATKAFA
jgi:hypothetical protein